MFARLFEFPFIEKLVNVLHPLQSVDGGSTTRTKSGKLRWSFCRILNDEDAKLHDFFRQKLMDSEPDFPFAVYAREMCKLPEGSSVGGPEWRKTLSPA